MATDTVSYQTMRDKIYAFLLLFPEPPTEPMLQIIAAYYSVNKESVARVVRIMNDKGQIVMGKQLRMRLRAPADDVGVHGIKSDAAMSAEGQREEGDGS